MADPLSVLGAALGVTSLIIQIMDECIKGASPSFGNVPLTLIFIRIPVLHQSSQHAK